MKYFLSFIILVALSFSACQKPKMPELGSHKFTYFLETDGILMVRYFDSNGTLLTDTVINEKWHKTFDVEIGDTMYSDFLPLMDCNVAYYFAQDGTITHEQGLTFRIAYHGLKGTFFIE